MLLISNVHLQPSNKGEERDSLWGDGLLSDLSPGSAVARSDRSQATQRLSEVRVERRQREAAQALQLPGGVSVEVLRAMVEHGQWQQRHQEPGQAVTYHHQHAQQVERVRQQDVQIERQAVVHGVQVRGETVENATHRGGVKERHRGLKQDVNRKLRVGLATSHPQKKAVPVPVSVKAALISIFHIQH